MKNSQRFVAQAGGALAIALLTALPAHALVGGAAQTADGAPQSAVMIVGSRGTFCTGTAIARDLVLTAAHCAQPGADYKILDFDAARAPVLRDLARIAIHPSFNLQTFLAHRATADVALLKLAQPLPAKYSLAVVDPAPRRVVAGDKLGIEGYGVTRHGDDKSSGKLRQATLQVTGVPGSLQIRLFDPATKGEKPGLGACTGDSGGPLFDAQNGTRKVIGVVSWSTGPKASAGCGGLTGVTPLLSYVKWISETAAKLGSPLPQ